MTTTITAKPGTLPAEEIANIVREFEESNPSSDIRMAKERIAADLHAVVIKDYVIRSQGDSDTNQFKWKKTKQPNPIMIDSGKLLANVTVRVIDGGLSVGVDTNIVPYAEHALAKRPLWKGKKMPATWVDSIKKSMARELKVLIEKRLQK